MNFCYPRDLKEGFNAFQVTTRFINEGAMVTREPWLIHG